MDQDKREQDKQIQDSQNRQQTAGKPTTDKPGADTHDQAGRNPGSQGRGQGQVQGEGDYDAARRYEEKMRDHVQHHDIEQEARDAKPASAGEEREMEQAEEAGKSRAKEEDPLLRPEGSGDGKTGTKPRPR